MRRRKTEDGWKDDKIRADVGNKTETE
ncbi:hypothetical protein EYF80_063116 [Liparis tanakae]|uniref:Uncharacterized protein n=1 Tax=Liparis tanakae TaxID=230148 RepID=A0A4Z2ED13_9TELE|nr:hypothetical protein EYF80_063116 [Liparis tanakae]